MTSVSHSKDSKVSTTLQLNNYRPDIDGLRAIAVISVILYHFKIQLFSGGFVGVDIFFVISGYLITKGILDKNSKGTFEFSDFYFRRVRRLIPALLVTIVASYIASFVLFSPADFKQMSGSTLYALSGVSNVFFWMESGYFDTSSIVKPLLHTWSLSVEIQFYIIWPIVFYLIAKAGKVKLLATCLCVVAGCAAAVIYLDKDSSGAFFLTPFRIHEFLFGAIVVLVERFRINKFLNGLAYLFGLVVILYSMMFFDIRATKFPGYAALLPVLGASLMIYAGNSTGFSAPLRSWLATKIGEISYSLYLVHWPIYVFVSYIFFERITPLGVVGLLIATFIFAFALYALIEKPFRSPANSRLSGAEFSLATLGVAALVMVVSSSSWAMNGWDWRLPASIRNIAKIDHDELDKYVWRRQDAFNLRGGFDSESGKEKVLVIGDSQAADLVNMLAEGGHAEKMDIVARSLFTNCSTFYLEPGEENNFFTKVNIMTIQSPELIEPCKLQMARVLDAKLLDQADRVYIAFRWNPEAISYNEKAIAKIVSMTKAKVYVFGRKNLLKSSIELVTALGRTSGIDHFAAKFKSDETKSLNERLAAARNVNFVDLMKITCPKKTSCAVLSPNETAIFFDPSHLSKDGAAYFGKSIAALIDSSSLNN
ncbi:acyltransferase family protein [Pseudomonas fluorescens]|nr:acyltransferase family protein [Pseudomonas fluorescens]